MPKNTDQPNSLRHRWLSRRLRRLKARRARVISGDDVLMRLIGHLNDIGMRGLARDAIAVADRLNAGDRFEKLAGKILAHMNNPVTARRADEVLGHLERVTYSRDIVQARADRLARKIARIEAKLNG